MKGSIKVSSNQFSSSFHSDLAKEKMSNYRWKVEKDFYNSFKTFLGMNQVFGSAPVKLNLVTHDRSEKIIDKVLNIGHLIYGLAICASVLFATYLQHSCLQHSCANASVSFLTGILYMGEHFIGAFNLLLVILGCQYWKKFYKIFFNRLVNVDINLQKCGIQPNFHPTQVYLRRSMIVYAIFFSFVMLVDLIYNQFIAENFIRSSTVHTIPNVTTVLALTQYSTVLHYIRDKLRTINAILIRLGANDRQEHNKLNVIAVLSINRGQNGTVKILNSLRQQHAELSRLPSGTFKQVFRTFNRVDFGGRVCHSFVSILRVLQDVRRIGRDGNLDDYLHGLVGYFVHRESRFDSLPHQRHHR